MEILKKNSLDHTDRLTDSRCLEPNIILYLESAKVLVSQLL